jgi:hypothetical protein
VIGLPDRSALGRGVTIAAKEDAFDRPQEDVQKKLEAITEAALV